jgi:hypothetical protein
VVVQVSLNRLESIPVPHEPADHQSPLERRNDQGRELLRVNAFVDVTLFQALFDDLYQVIAKLSESFAHSVAQDRITII